MNDVQLHEMVLQRHKAILAHRAAEEAAAASPAGSSFAANLPQPQAIAAKAQPTVAASPAVITPRAATVATAPQPASAAAVADDAKRIPSLTTDQMAVLERSMGASGASPSSAAESAIPDLGSKTQAAALRAAAPIVPAPQPVRSAMVTDDTKRIPTLTSDQIAVLEQSMGVQEPGKAAAAVAAAPAAVPDLATRAQNAAHSVALPHDQVALLTASLGLDHPKPAAAVTAPSKNESDSTAPVPSLTDAQMASLMQGFGTKSARPAAQPAAIASVAPAAEEAPKSPAPIAAAVTPASPGSQPRFFPIQPRSNGASNASQAYLNAVHAINRNVIAPSLVNHGR